LSILSKKRLWNLTWSISKYDFYENALFLDDPVEADLNRKQRCLAPKIGTEPRFQGGNFDQNPGP
jgi:hypothetical protein